MNTIIAMMRLVKKPVMAGIDITVLLLGTALSVWIFEPDIKSIAGHYTGPVTFSLILSIFVLYTFNLYDFKRFMAKGDTAIRVGMALFIANIGLAALFFSLDHWFFPQDIFFGQIVLSTLGVITVRWIIAAVAGTLPKEKIIIIGAGHSGLCIGGILKSQVVGFIDDNEDIND